MIIDGATPEWFGPFAAQHQIVLYELTPTGDTLEDVFLRLTHGFDAADPGQMGEPAGRQPVIAIVRAGVAQAPHHRRPLGDGVIAILINGLLILGIFLTQEGTRPAAGAEAGVGLLVAAVLRPGRDPPSKEPASRSPTPPSSCATWSARGSRSTSSPCSSGCS